MYGHGDAEVKKRCLENAGTIANNLSEMFKRLDTLDDSELKLVVESLKFLNNVLEAEVDDRLERLNSNWN